MFPFKSCYSLVRFQETGLNLDAPHLPRHDAGHYRTIENRHAPLVVSPPPSSRTYAFFLDLISICSDQGAKGQVGLLVCERMINCPMQAVPKLHEALVEDIAWAIENEVSFFPLTEAKRDAATISTTVVAPSPLWPSVSPLKWVDKASLVMPRTSPSYPLPTVICLLFSLFFPFFFTAKTLAVGW